MHHKTITTCLLLVVLIGMACGREEKLKPTKTMAASKHSSTATSEIDSTLVEPHRPPPKKKEVELISNYIKKPQQLKILNNLYNSLS